MRRRPAERRRRVRVVRLHAQGVGRVERSVPPHANRAHEFGAAPASSRTARLIARFDAATGAGLVRRRAVERPRRVRVERRNAQGLGRVDRSVPPDADRAHGLSAAPASSRHNAPIARRRREGRRSTASLPSRTTASCPDRATTRSRSGTRRPAPASRHCAGTDAQRGAGVPSNRASIARRRRDGRRSIASPSCRMTASCPGRATTRSWCGTCRPAPASRRCAGTRTRHGAGVQSNRASIARRRRDGRRFGASPSSRTAALFPRRSTAHSRSG